MASSSTCSVALSKCTQDINSGVTSVFQPFERLFGPNATADLNIDNGQITSAINQCKDLKSKSAECLNKAQCDKSGLEYTNSKVVIDSISNSCQLQMCGVQNLVCSKNIWKSCGWDGKDTKSLNWNEILKCTCAHSADLSKCIDPELCGEDLKKMATTNFTQECTDRGFPLTGSGIKLLKGPSMIFSLIAALALI